MTGDYVPILVPVEWFTVPAMVAYLGLSAYIGVSAWRDRDLSPVVFGAYVLASIACLAILIYLQASPPYPRI